MIPTFGNISKLKTKCKLVLVIEKEATFMRLAEDKFHINQKCILITGKGYPDVGTLRMVKMLSLKSDIKVLGLFDFDPHGLEILCVYKFGSISSAYCCNKYSTNQMKWIGIHFEDLIEKDITLIPFSNEDKRLANSMYNERELLKSDANLKWREQLGKMISISKKAEIQSLSSHSPYFTNCSR